MKNNASENVKISDLIAAEEELQRLREEHGISKEEKGISKLISWVLTKKENRTRHEVNRKKYLLLGLFTGFLGGHHFYAKRYVLGSLYLVFCWTGIPIAMTLFDLMIAIPMEANTEGNFMI